MTPPRPSEPRMNFSYLAKRIFSALITLFGLSVIIFVISHLIPGDPARLALGPLATGQQVQHLREQLGMNLPLPQQYLRYISGLLHGDLGFSLVTQRPVAKDIAERLPATLELVIAAAILILFVGVPLGALAARYQNSWFDSLLRLLSIAGVVTPSFFTGILLQIIFGYFLNILPVSGELSLHLHYQPGPTGMPILDGILAGHLAISLNALRHLILPAVSLALADLGQIARITRASMIDTSKREYIRAQRSYGISNLALTFKYMLKPSFIPSLTLFGLAVASLLGNAFLVELVFSWPGIASYAAHAILQKDINAVIGVVLVFGVFFIVANLAVDIVAGYVNPRLRLGGGRD